MKSLESLAVGFNKITDWEGFQNVPNLRALTAPENGLTSFKHVPILKELESLDLSKNPIVEMNKFKELSAALFDNLKELNREKLSDELLKSADIYRGKIAQAVRYGMLIPNDEKFDDINNLLIYTDEWLLDFYRDVSKTTPFQLLSYTFDPIQPVQGVDCRFYCVFFVKTKDVTSLKAEGMGLLTLNNINGEWTNILFEGSSLCINIEQYQGDITLLVPIGCYSYKLTNAAATSETFTVNVEPISSECKDPEYTIDVAWNNNKHHSCIRPSIEDIDVSMNVSLHFKWHKDDLFVIHQQTLPVIAAHPSCTGLEIIGYFIEGSTVEPKYVYRGGDEGQSKFEWRRVKMFINEDDLHDVEVISREKCYTLQREDYGHLIVVTCIPVRSDGVEGKPVSCVSPTTIDAPNPRITNLAIGEMVQDQTSSVTYGFVGGEEADTCFQWFVETNGEFVKVKNATTREFTPGIKQIGQIVKCVVTPVNSYGKYGEPCEIISKPVAPASPVFAKVSVESDNFIENDMISIQTEYYGGFEGDSMFEFFRLENEVEEKIENGNCKEYRAGLADVGKVIKILCTPVRNDGRKGEVVEVKTPVIQAGAPKIHDPVIVGNMEVGSTLSICYRYEGGVEGDTIIEWRKTKPFTLEELTRSDIVVEGLDFDIVMEEQELSHTITADDAGCFFAIEVTPVRNDMAKGEGLILYSTSHVAIPKPSMANCKIVMNEPELTEGCILRGMADYCSAIEEKARMHKWYKIDETGMESEIEGADQETFLVPETMFEKKIKYSCYSIDKFGQSTERAYSEPTGTVLPSKPCITGISIFGILEEFSAVHVGEIQGKNVDTHNIICDWYRIRPEDLNSDVKVASGVSSYDITTADIGNRLKLVFTPIRPFPYSHVSGQNYVHITDVIGPSKPHGSCCLMGSFKEGEAFTASFNYTGGTEGRSTYRLMCRNPADDTKSIISEGTTSNNAVSFVCRKEDVGKQFILEYTPIREDGMEGDMVLFTSELVLPGEPSISELNLEFVKNNRRVLIPIEDCIIRASGKYFGGNEGKSLKLWKRVDSALSLTEIVGTDSMEYHISIKDIGKQIQFEYTPVRDDDVKGIPQSIMTETVQGHHPSVSNVSLSGSPRLCSKLTVAGQYYGGVEGDSEIEWFASHSKSGPFKRIQEFDNTIVIEESSSTTGKSSTITLSMNCLLLFIKAKYTPVRSDKVIGSSVETNVLQVDISPDIKEKIIKAIMQCSAIEFCENGVLELGNKHIRYGEVKPHIKEKWRSQSATLLSENSFSIHFEKGGDHIFNSKQALYLVLLVRIFSLLSSSNDCAIFCGEKFQKAWMKGKVDGVVEEWNQIQASMMQKISTDREDAKALIALFK